MPAHIVRAVLVALAVVAAGIIGRALLTGPGTTPFAGPAVETVAAAVAPATSFSAPSPVPTGVAPAAGTDPAGGGVAAVVSGAPSVVVHVVGRVRRPGLVTIDADARVADAVAAAGGANRTAALGRINLARRPADGEQILVPGPNDPVPAPAAAGAAAPSDAAGGTGGTGLLDLNAATGAQLEQLPGVGPVTAERILAWRREHHRFSRVEELGEVSGIGPKTLERLRPLVTV